LRPDVLQSTDDAVQLPAGRPQERFYRPELDVLRFTAFFLVFLYHLSFFRPGTRGWLFDSVTTGGTYGMSLFFVLSSYLITSLLMKERAQTGTVSIWSFYVRRVLRIWPLYVLFLLAMFFVGRFYTPWLMRERNLAAFFLLAGNWYLLYAPVPGPVLPLWSISLEEQFYLFWPTLFRSLSLKRFVQACATITVLSLISVGYLSANGAPVWRVWWNTLPQLQYFSVGALLAIFGDRLFLRTTPSSRLISSSLAAACFLAAGFANRRALMGSTAGLVLSYFLAAVGCVCVFQAFRDAQLSSAWLYLGRISYGLYVFHQLAMDLVDLWLRRVLHVHSVLLVGALGLILTVAMASISYPLLEKPFLRWKRRFELIRSR
jgi:peptidoglycan/LPS O-acetylase OafA/YrhL